MKNTGFEMALTYRGNVGDLKYTVTGNIATNKNKVVDLAGSDDIISNGGDKIRFILREGEPIGSSMDIRLMDFIHKKKLMQDASILLVVFLMPVISNTFLNVRM